MKSRWLPLWILLVAPSVRAEDRLWSWEWTARDTYLQASMAALQLADLSQTSWAMRRPHYVERNPWLGSHPSRQRLCAMVGGAILGHVAISAALPHPLRASWQALGIILEVGAVSGNAYLGVGFDLP